MSAYLDGDLAARSRERLERHLGECPECSRVIAGLRRLVAGLNQLPAPDGPGASQIALGVRKQLGEPTER
ncbi:MAG: zf-HC2 domain-containing protein [Solirubrobacterales bacterium]|nr:zf-HC2 domain-containing protein [Solirubrobacterales bacterium]